MSSQIANDEYSQALRLGQKEYRELLMAGKSNRIVCTQDGGITDLELSVRLQVGNVDIVVSSRPRQTMCKGPYEMVGINYTEMRYLGLKSSQHFKGWWTGKAKTMIPCESPGVHSADLGSFAYQHLDTSYFPMGDPEWK